MSVFRFIKSMFGGSSASGPDFANIAPDDIETYWLAECEVDAAEREGEEALRAVFLKYELRDADHWERVDGSFRSRHHENPDFYPAMARVQYRFQMASHTIGYEIPPEYEAPVEGVSLSDYAKITARVEGASPQGDIAVASTLASYGLDPARFNTIDMIWKSRMGGQADAMAATVLSGLYDQYLMLERNAVSRGL